MTGLGQADCHDATSPPPPRPHRALGLRRLLLSTQRDRARGALYLRFGLSYRDVEELLAERGLEVGTTTVTPNEVVTDKAATYPIVLDELLPAVRHRTEQYANNHIEADHGRLKARLRPMRGLKQDQSARVVIVGHAFVENLRRGHYELAVEVPVGQRLAVAFGALALAI